MPRKVPLIHPGVILLEDWLKPMNISQYAIAKAIDVPPRRINEIVKRLRGITEFQPSAINLIAPHLRSAHISRSVPR